MRAVVDAGQDPDRNAGKVCIREVTRGNVASAQVRAHRVRDQNMTDSLHLPINLVGLECVPWRLALLALE